jgi:hypothetical protein
MFVHCRQKDLEVTELTNSRHCTAPNLSAGRSRAKDRRGAEETTSRVWNREFQTQDRWQRQEGRKLHDEQLHNLRLASRCDKAIDENIKLEVHVARIGETRHAQFWVNVWRKRGPWDIETGVEGNGKMDLVWKVMCSHCRPFWWWWRSFKFPDSKIVQPVNTAVRSQSRICEFWGSHGGQRDEVGLVGCDSVWTHRQARQLLLI